jgi:hypothetical protein
VDDVEEREDDDEEWPPRPARVRAALWQGEGHLLRREWAHGAKTLAEAVPIADDPDVFRGLRLLCAAGYQAREGEVERARAQIARARERLAPFLPEYEDVDLAAIVAAVTEAVEEHAA